MRLPTVKAPFLLLVCFSCATDKITTPARLTVPSIPSRLVVVPAPGAQDNFKRGVNYFTGWTLDPACQDPNLSNSDIDKTCAAPWSKVQNWTGSPPRGPSLGWYTDTVPATTDAQILAMVDAGYDYVIYQMMWSHKKWGAVGTGSYRGQTIRNHMASPYASKLKFAVSWDDVNSKLEKTCVGCEAYNYWKYELGWDATRMQNDYSALFTLWFRDYASSPNYYRYNSRPVVFFFNPERLKTPRTVQGTTYPTAQGLISLLRSVAAQYGFSGSTTPFVIGQNVPDAYLDSLPAWGFDANTGYVYNSTYTDSLNSNYHPLGDRFSLSQYQTKWNAMIDSTNYQRSHGHSIYEYWVPNATGRDDRPWGGAYVWTATSNNFESLVQAAIVTANNYSAATGRNLISCCWNEWGEGAYIEPSTMDYGFSYRGSALSDAHRRTVLGQPAGSNRQPGGWFDMISSDGYAAGWGIDPDTPNQPILVHFYKNDYYPYGQFIGGTLMNYYRGDVNSQYGIEGVHGFWFKLPVSACNSYIYVHLIDSSGNDENPHLGGGPRYYTC